MSEFHPRYDRFPGGNAVVKRINPNTLVPVFLSDSFLRLVHSDRETFMEQAKDDFIAVVHPDDHAYAKRVFLTAMDDMQPFVATLRLCPNPDKPVWVNANCEFVAEGNELYIYIAYTDVSEQMRLREELSASETWLQTVLTQVPVGVGVGVVRGDKVVSSSVNPAFRALLGVDSGFADDPAITARIHPDDLVAVAGQMRRLAVPGGHIQCAFRYRAETEYRWYQLNARAIAQGDQTVVFTCVSDITEQKEAEQRIRQAEAQEKNLRQIYEAAIEAAALFLMEYDFSTRTVTLMDNLYTVHKAAELGFPHVIEDAPAYFLKSLDAENAAAFQNMMSDLERGRQQPSYTLQFLSKSERRPLVVRLSFAVTVDEAGTPIRVFAVSQNMTRLYVATDTFHRQLNSLRTDRKSNLIAKGYANLTRCRIEEYYPTKGLAPELEIPADYALSREQLISFGASEADRSKLNQFSDCQWLIDQYGRGITQLSTEYQLKTENNVYGWARLEILTMEKPDSHDILCFVEAYDITEKHLEQLIVECMTALDYDYIGVINPATRSFTYRGSKLPAHNPAETFGYDLTLLNSVRDTVAQDEQQAVLDAACLDQVQMELSCAGHYFFSYNALEGDQIRRKLMQYCYLDQVSGSIFFCKSDITMQYQQEQRQVRQMEDALRLAEQANHAKTEFISRISHDIRTPISAILSMTAFAREDRLSPKKLDNDLDKIEVSSQFLLSLINDVLDISKIDSGRIELSLEPYAYSDFSSNIRNMLEPLCQQKHQTFDMQCIGQVGCVMVDKIRLNQIVFNLLSNSVKYTPEGGTVAFHTISQRSGGGMVSCDFVVEDTGIGMSEQFQREMFQPFTQDYANPDRPKTASGTGLGLSIVKRLVDLMHGSIQVESRLGHGSRFSLHFDFREATGEMLRVDTAQETPSSAPICGKILLAEDNPINAEIAVRLLEHFGMSVVTVADGVEAVEAFRRSSHGEYAAILMDLQMPVQNGYEAAKTIRELSRPDAATVPIIAMTADAFDGAMQRCFEVGMNDYITKPVNPAQLRGSLERLIPSAEPQHKGEK